MTFHKAFASAFIRCFCSFLVRFVHNDELENSKIVHGFRMMFVNKMQQLMMKSVSLKTKEIVCFKEE